MWFTGHRGGIKCPWYCHCARWTMAGPDSGQCPCEGQIKRALVEAACQQRRLWRPPHITRHTPRAALCHEQTLAILFNYLVGAQQKRRGNGNAERVRRFEVDDQLEFSGLLDPQICGLAAA